MGGRGGGKSTAKAKARAKTGGSKLWTREFLPDLGGGGGGGGAGGGGGGGGNCLPFVARWFYCLRVCTCSMFA